jgi:hypothetical protein
MYVHEQILLNNWHFWGSHAVSVVDVSESTAFTYIEVLIWDEVH